MVSNLNPGQKQVDRQQSLNQFQKASQPYGENLEDDINAQSTNEKYSY